MTAPAVRVSAEAHNRVLRAATKRVDDLEPRLVRILEPILARAGKDAAEAFRSLATDHVSASALRQADRDALRHVRARPLSSGLVGIRLRPEALTAAAPSPTTAMVCLKPRPDEAQALVDPGGEPAEYLHVTLVAFDAGDADLAPVAEALRQVAATHAPLEGVVGGYGRFEPAGVGILLPDVPGLVELRVAVTEALLAADLDYFRDHGFEAHITVDADPSPDDQERMLALAGAPLHFDSLLVVRGDTETLEIPLVGVPPLTAAGDARWSAPGVDELIDADALAKRIREKTDPVRHALVRSTMQPSLQQAGLSFEVTNPLVAKVLTQTGKHVVGIADTTRANVIRIIRAAHAEGLSIPHTADLIQQGMKDAAKSRAITIARCLPSDALIDGAVVRAVTRRWYEGDMAVVVTESGREFAATPNHPMLTSRGWRAAGEVEEGEYLICRSGQKYSGAARHQHVADPPPTIAEVFEAASAVGVVERRTGGEPDFHGDGRDGEVDIARPDGELTIGSFTALFDQGCQNLFAPSDMTRRTLFCTGCGHLLAVDKEACLCGTPRGDSCVAQDAPDQRIRDVERATDRLHSSTAAEASDDIGGIDVVAASRRATTACEELRSGVTQSPALDSCCGEPIENRALVDPDTPSGIRSADAGDVESDRVVACRLVPYVGYVFNLCTPYGYFTTNGGYTGNTELVGAVNGGSLAATQLAGDATGTTYLKRWMTAPGAPHPRHELYPDLDGQTVALDEYFQVGGAQLAYPGDPDGDADEVIQCRCAMAYDDAEGEQTSDADEPPDFAL